jgi:transposase-like protein
MVPDDRSSVDRTRVCRLGVNLAAERGVLGMWVGTGGERQAWMACLSELRIRDVAEVCIVALRRFESSTRVRSRRHSLLATGPLCIGGPRPREPVQ